MVALTSLGAATLPLCDSDKTETTCTCGQHDFCKLWPDKAIFLELLISEALQQASLE